MDIIGYEWKTVGYHYWKTIGMLLRPGREDSRILLGFSDSMGTAGNWDLARLRSGSAHGQNVRIDARSIVRVYARKHVRLYTVHIYISDIYFQMICQKLCLNNVSRWGSLEESNFVCGSSSKSKLFEPEICLGSFYHLHYEKCHFGR